MKKFIKIFLCTMVIFLGIASFFLYNYYKDMKAQNENYKPNYESNWYESMILENGQFSESYNKLIKAINNSHRINFLFMGLEWPRTDTLMLVSFDEKTKNVDIMSIPRDTYYYKEGFRSGFKDKAEYKINAIYGDEGPEGVKKAVEDIFKIPIHHYASITYKGVENIVDAIGGVEVDVPINMYYRDDWDDPPLLIDIKKGHQVLYGEKAVEFLRFRQNSDGSVKYGDTQRIKLQQQFIKSAIEKTLSLKLPLVIKEVFYCVKTDVSLVEILDYANSALGMNMENIHISTAPGEAFEKYGYSYFRIDKDKLQSVVFGLYGVEEIKNAANAD